MVSQYIIDTTVVHIIDETVNCPNYSLMQSDLNSLYGDVIFDSVNMAFRILSQIYSDFYHEDFNFYVIEENAYKK